jgi:hypothetical protein
MNAAINALVKVFSGKAKVSSFDISIKDCIEAAKELGIKEFDAKLLNAKFRELAFNEAYNNYKAASAAE